MNRTEGTPTVAPQPVSHEDARCTTRTNSFSQKSDSSGNSAKFAHLPVSLVMEDVTPKCLGAELQDNGYFVSTKAWAVEKHINFGKVAYHLGKKLISAAREKMADTLTNALGALYNLESDTYFDNLSTYGMSQTAVAYADTILDMLHMVTDIRNVEGTEADWKEHLECIKKGRSNPRYPKNPLLAKFIDKAFKCEELRDQLKAKLDENPDKLRLADFARMDSLYDQLTQDIAELYKETLENLEEMTGFTIEEILDEAYGIELEFYTAESKDKPEAQRETQVMTMAEGHGFTDRNKLEAALRGNLNSLGDDIIDRARERQIFETDLHRLEDPMLYNMLNIHAKKAGSRITMPEYVTHTDINKLPRRGSNSSDSGIVSDGSSFDSGDELFESDLEN